MNICHAANHVEDIRDSIGSRAPYLMSIDDQLVIGQGWLAADRCTRIQSIQVHGDGAVGRETEGVLAVAPVFDESNIGIRLSGGGGHGLMIPPLLYRGAAYTAAPPM